MPEPGEGLRPEALVRPESRSDVISAFNRAVDLVDHDNQSHPEPQKQWILDSINNAKSQDFNEDTYTYTNSFTEASTGGKLSQREGIPVDELILFLRNKSRFFPEGSDIYHEYSRLADILYRNSYGYFEGKTPHTKSPRYFIE